MRGLGAQGLWGKQSPQTFPVSLTWNPADRSTVVSLSNSNRTMTLNGPNNGASARTVQSFSSGKWYWEYTTPNTAMMGICLAAADLAPNAYMGCRVLNGWGFYTYPSGGQATKYRNSSPVNYGPVINPGARVGMALDLSAGKIWFSVNGTWCDGGDPVAGSLPAYGDVSGTVYGAAACDSAGYTLTIPATTLYPPPAGYTVP